MPEGAERVGFGSALAHREFRYLVASLTTSGIGDWFYNVALVVLVLDLTDSPAWVAAASIGRLLPYMLFGTIAGALADRHDRRAVMIASDLVRAAFMVCLTVAALVDAPVAIPIVISFLSTAAGTPFFPAVAAVTPSVVDERNLAPANGLIGTIDSVTIAVGPALGGLLLIAGSPTVAFAVNAVTFVVSALLLARLKVGELERQEAQSLRRQIAEGVDAVTSSPGAVMVVALLTAGSLTYGQESVLYPLVSLDLLGTGSEGVGFLFAAIGVGGVLGASFTNRLADHPRPAFVLTIAGVVAAVPFLTLPFVRVPTLAYLLVGLEGAAFILVDVLGTTLLQRSVPSELVARVFGILDSLAVAGTVLGALLTPVLLNAFGLRGGLLIAGWILIALTLACLPRLRALNKVSQQRVVEIEPRVELLRRLDIFTSMSRPALETLAGSVVEQSVAPGEVVVREGDPADDFYVVVEGTLNVTARGEAGGPARTVNQLEPGGYFGEIGLLGQIPRTATVEAAAEGRLYRISGGDFLAAVTHSPAAYGAVYAGASGRLARTHPSFSLRRERLEPGEK